MLPIKSKADHHFGERTALNLTKYILTSVATQYQSVWKTFHYFLVSDSEDVTSKGSCL